ncbi:MAG: glycosyltransferase family 39 protein [Methanobrevibacter sp. CfCl-M3]
MNILRDKFKTYELVGMGLSILAILLLIITVFLGLNSALSTDEGFTFHLMGMSFQNIVLATASDVHPPLYYIVLKCIMNIVSPENSFNIIVGKLFSLVPIILLIFFSLIKLRKDWGWLASGIFTFCIVTMPRMMFYGIEARMYSLSIFFVTLSFYYCYLITKQANGKNWIIFILFSLFAAYTHYYCLFAVGFLYILLLYNIISKSRNLIKRWLISVIVTVLCYVPWIYLLINYSKYFSTSQWIQPTIKDIILMIGFIFSPIKDVYEFKYLLKSIWTTLFEIFGILLLISFIVLIFTQISKKNKGKRGPLTFIELGGIFLIFSTSIFVIIFSILIKPMIEPRYLTPFLGCLWLSFAVLLSKTYSTKKIFTPILIILILTGFSSSVTLIDFKHYYGESISEFENNLNQIDKNDTVIFLIYPWAEYFVKYYYHGSNIIIWDYVNPTIIDGEEASKKGHIWLYDMGIGVSDIRKGKQIKIGVNTTLVNDGFKLENVSLLIIPDYYRYYTSQVYEIKPR